MFFPPNMLTFHQFLYNITINNWISFSKFSLKGVKLWILWQTHRKMDLFSYRKWFNEKCIKNHNMIYIEKTHHIIFKWWINYINWIPVILCLDTFYKTIIFDYYHLILSTNHRQIKCSFHSNYASSQMWQQVEGMCYLC